MTSSTSETLAASLTNGPETRRTSRRASTGIVAGSIVCGVVAALLVGLIPTAVRRRRRIALVSAHGA
jgi:hypothetical protein